MEKASTKRTENVCKGLCSGVELSKCVEFSERNLQKFCLNFSVLKKAGLMKVVRLLLALSFNALEVHVFRYCACTLNTWDPLSELSLLGLPQSFECG